ncbi:hypothetical protein [Yoonia sp. I 8.24]|uniref:hypothetical protein n=1 Tax=Yoonia sp. I 8.24 TaxID=1537229 RepID=UPI001EDD5DC8|nr:hypothetical protein [Yoonia sp. I 8.24]MCG3267471.1 hypothetical protein [Yoonia sp. I 8.24]
MLSLRSFLALTVAVAWGGQLYAEDIDLTDYPEIDAMTEEEWGATEDSLLDKMDAVEESGGGYSDLIDVLTKNEYDMMVLLHDPLPEGEEDLESACKIGADGRQLLLGDQLAGDDWSLTFTGNYTVVNGKLVPHTDPLPPILPARLVSVSGGYDVYVASRQVPEQTRWQIPVRGELDFTLADVMTAAPEFETQVEEVFGCPFEEYARIVSYREQDGGYDQMVMIPIDHDFIVGLMQSARGPATSSYMLMLER